MMRSMEDSTILDQTLQTMEQFTHYYWDLAEEKWYGPIYNSGTENPESRSNAGMAYDKKNNTVYIYGGILTTGQGPVIEDIGIERICGSGRLIPTHGPRYGNLSEKDPDIHFDMVWNENDGSIYFFGGRFY